MVKSDRFAWGVILFGLWLIIGVYLDGWNHVHRPELESFFTWWHAVLYSGFLATWIFILARLFKDRSKGWSKALPVGYGLSVLGGLFFFFNGFGDMAWHIVFGIEQGVEALLSPTHLGLALGAGLLISGPFRNAWYGKNKKMVWTAVISLAFLLSVFTFMTENSNPLANPYSEVGMETENPDHNHSIGTTGIYLYTIILMSLLLLAVLRWKLPFGAVTLILVINALLLAMMFEEYRFIPAVLLTGLFADFLLKKRMSKKNFHLFAFLVPFVLFGLYFLTIHFTKGIEWTVHLWSGSIFVAGLIGLIISYVLEYAFSLKKTVVV
jgi:hypothetical protein